MSFSFKPFFMGQQIKSALVVKIASIVKTGQLEKSSVKKVALLFILSGVIGLSGCASSSKCGDPGHAYHTVSEGPRLQAPPGLEIPEEDFNIVIPEVPASAKTAEQQIVATRGCTLTPPVSESLDIGAAQQGNPAARSANSRVKPQSQPRVLNRDRAGPTPKAPIY